MLSNKISYEIITEELNKIFFNIDLKIRKSVEKDLNLTTRNTKIKYDMALLYSLLYTEKYKRKDEVVNDINNFEQTTKYKNTTLYEKEDKIPLSFYCTLFKSLHDLYNKLYNKDDKLKIMAVDGCYNNTNLYNIKQFLETSLNMGFYNVTDEIPIDFSFCGFKNKNNEIKQLIEYINNKKDYFQNIILVADRAYCSYNFINFLSKNKIKYVIRFRNNCKNFCKIEKDKYRIINSIISYTDTIENVKIDNYTIDDKYFKSVSYKYTDEYKILTNLDNSYTDNDILEIYHKRWSVEVFFKIIKNNYKFEDLRITNNDGNSILYQKYNLKILIVHLINSIISKGDSLINDIKEEGTIKKRIFKNKKVKKNKIEVAKKTKKTKTTKEEKEEVINVSLKDNPNILINNKK